MINFETVETNFHLKNKLMVRNWAKSLLSSEGQFAGDITYIFCNDNYLAELNKQYLKHNTLTDIITFDYSEFGKVSGDIFISIERVQENALSFGTHFNAEVGRVMAHGILHLVGYKDKKPCEKLIMRNKEDFYLASFPNI
jgi:rRNA maturation RNase YbeY